MKRASLLTLLALAASVFFVSCKNASTGLYIPKDAAMVLHINTTSLTSKLSWKEIKASSWFHDASKDEEDSLTRAILDNPEASGVNMKGDFAFFIQKRGKGGYMVFEGKIKDADAFEKLVQKMNRSEKVQKEGDLRVMETGSKSIVCWNNSTFLTLADAPIFSAMNPMNRSSYGSGEDYSFRKDSLFKFSKELLGLKSSKRIEDDSRFSKLLKESGDMHFWLNSEQYMSSIAGGALSVFKFGTLLKDNVSALTMSFDNGKISFKSKQYYGEEMAKLMEKYKPKDVSEALLNRIPSGDIMGVMAFNFDPKTMKEFVTAMGLDGVVNTYLSNANTNLDELLSASGGEFLLSLADFKMVKKEVTQPPYYEGGTPYTYTTTTPDFKMLVAASVANKGTFEKLLNLAKNRMEGRDTMLKYRITNEWFAAGNYMETVDKFLAGGNNKMPFADKISGHPFGMYVDLQKIFRAVRTSDNRESDSALLAIASTTWQDIVATGGEYKGGTMSSVFEVNMVDKSTNSLKQLNQFVEKMSVAQKALREKRQREMDMMPTMPPPIDTTVEAPAMEAPMRDN